MPRFEVADDQGRTLILEGDSQPTEQDIQAAFDAVYSSQPQEPPVEPPKTPQDASDFMGVGQEVEGGYNALRRGSRLAMANGGTQALISLDGQLQELSKVASESKANLAAYDEQVKANPQLAQSPNHQRYLDNLLSTIAHNEREFNRVSAMRPKVVQAVSENTAAANAIPRSPDLANLDKDFWGTLASNPIETIATVSLESLPQMAPAMVATVVTANPVAGAAFFGVNSLAVESASTISQTAGELGYDLSKPDQAEKFFNDPKAFGLAKQRGMERGVPVAMFDAASAGFAGRMLKPAIGQGTRQVLTASAKEIGAQMLAGAGGEASGQLALSGQITSVPDIVMEAIAELGSGPAEVLGNVREDVAAAMKTKQNLQRSADNAEAAGMPATAQAQRDMADGIEVPELTQAQAEAIIPTPEATENTITLYRAIGGESFSDVFDKEKLSKFEHPEKPGSFWTSEPDYAEYFKESYGKGSEIISITIPKSEAEGYRVSPIEFKIPESTLPEQPPVSPETPSSPGDLIELTDEQRYRLAKNIVKMGWDPEAWGMTQAEVDALVAGEQPPVSPETPSSQIGEQAPIGEQQPALAESKPVASSEQPATTLQEQQETTSGTPVVPATAIAQEAQATPGKEAEQVSLGQKVYNALDKLDKDLSSNTYADPLLLTPVAKLAVKLAKVLIKGGMAVSEAIKQAIADARSQMPDATDDDAQLLKSIQSAIDAETTKQTQGTVAPTVSEQFPNAGDYQTEVQKNLEKRAEQRVNSKDPKSLIDELYKGDPKNSIDPSEKQWTVALLLNKLENEIRAAEERMQSLGDDIVAQVNLGKEIRYLREQLNRAADISQKLGTVAGQEFVARRYAMERMIHLTPSILLRNIIRKKQDAALVKNKIADKAGDTEKTFEQVKAADEASKKSATSAITGTIEKGEPEAAKKSRKKKKKQSEAKRILDQYEQSQTEWLKPETVRSQIRTIIDRYLSSPQFKSQNEQDFISRLTNDLLGVTSEKVDPAIARRLAYEVWKAKIAAEAAVTQKAIQSKELQEQRNAESIINRFESAQTETMPRQSTNRVKEILAEAMDRDWSGNAQEFRKYVVEQLLSVGVNEPTAIRLQQAAFEQMKIDLANEARKIEESSKASKNKEIDKAIKNAMSLLRKAAKDADVDLSKIFTAFDRDTQAERRAELLKAISDAFPDLSLKQKTELEKALTDAWEKLRMDAFRNEFKRTIKLPTVEATRTVEATLPKLIKESNAGLLDNEAFRNAVAQRYGISEMSSETAKKLDELAQKAQKAPEGILRNRVLAEMEKVIRESGEVSYFDAISNSVFNSILSSPRTWIDVLTGSTVSGLAKLMAAYANLQIAGQRDLANKMMASWWNALLNEGIPNAVDIVRTGNITRISSFDQQIRAVLEGRGSLNTLESWRTSPSLFKRIYGSQEYVRRVMTALDYTSAAGTREAYMPYVAWARKDKASLDAMLRKYDATTNAQARQQAIEELGPGAKKLDITVRTREILEQGISQEIKDAGLLFAKRAAANADPLGIGGIVYNFIKRVPWYVKLPLGLGFLRASINMIQNAYDFMPGTAVLTHLRASTKGQEILGKAGLNLTPEELRMAVACNIMGVGLITACMWTWWEDDENGPRISGSWLGLTPKQKYELIGQGKLPLAIKIGNKWFSYKNMPFAPALAIVGNGKDRNTYHKAKEGESEESLIYYCLNVSLTSLGFFKDLSPLQQLTNIMGLQAYKTPGDEVEETWKKLAGSVGSMAVAGALPWSSALRDIDAWFDPKVYRPGKPGENAFGMEYLLRQIPFARRTVGPGPSVNMFGEPIEIQRYPWSRLAKTENQDPVWQAVARKTATGEFIPQVGYTASIVDKNTGQRRYMNGREYYDYSVAYGKALKSLISQNLKEFDRMSPMDAQEWIRSYADQLSLTAREQARLY